MVLTLHFFVEISDIYVRLLALGKTIKMWSILHIGHQTYLFYENSVVLIRGIILAFGCGNWGEPHKATLRTFGAPAETETKDISNTIQKRYRLNQIVGLHDGELRKTTWILEPITVAARCEVWTVFARSDTGIVGSNHTRGVDVCVFIMCLSCSVCR
jgi:hypothetical protein